VRKSRSLVSVSGTPAALTLASRPTALSIERATRRWLSLMLLALQAVVTGAGHGLRLARGVVHSDGGRVSEVDRP
jgi:hypothetical protein